MGRRDKQRRSRIFCQLDKTSTTEVSILRMLWQPSPCKPNTRIGVPVLFQNNFNSFLNLYSTYNDNVVPGKFSSTETSVTWFRGTTWTLCPFWSTQWIISGWRTSLSPVCWLQCIYMNIVTIWCANITSNTTYMHTFNFKRSNDITRMDLQYIPLKQDGIVLFIVKLLWLKPYWCWGAISFCPGFICNTHIYTLQVTMTAEP